MQKLNWTYKTDLEKAGLKVAKLIQAQGFQVFWVGGVVRNFLLKRVSDNIDIATDATPDEVERILEQAKIMHKPVGKEFGSILAIVNSQKIEITTFRSESRYSDNRHPDEVEFIQEYLDDAKRRDFTINTLYFDPVAKILFDPTKGLKDLKAKILRFVGDPKKRIDEDGLRMLRGVRLATELGFRLERNSFAAIKTRAKYIQDISGERVKAELDKILLSGSRIEGLRLLDQTGLLKFIAAEFEELKKVGHKSKYHHLEGNVFIHSLNAVSLLDKDSQLDLVYASLFHDIGKVVKPTPVFKDGEHRLSYIGHIRLSEEIFRKFADKFKFPKNQRDLIAWLIRHHDDRAQFRELTVKNQIKYLLASNIDLLLELWRVDSLANLRLIDGKKMTRISSSQIQGLKLLKKINASQHLVSKLAKGGLIMKYGHLAAGPQIGQKIEDVKVQIVLGKIKNEKDLQKYLQIKNAS